MFLHAIKCVLRNLSKHKIYTAINIVGLAIAIASCLILSLYLYSELTYDRHHLNHERIYRVANVYHNYDDGLQRRELAITSPVLGPMLANDFSEVEAFVRFNPVSDVLIRHDEEAYYWESAFNVDDNVFQVFTHEIIYGDPNTALVDPSSMAISRSVAEFYFGDSNPLGEIINLGDGNVRTVSLVFDDLPDNSHLKYDVLFSFNQPDLQIAVSEIPRWLFGVNSYTYILMPEGYKSQHFSVISETFYGQNMEQLARERTNRAWSGWLQPLASIHLGPDLLNDQPTGSRFYLYGFMSVVSFILLIAVINYINLATAGYSKHAPGIGIRKILGADRSWMVIQFLGESIFLALVSMGIGILLVELIINQGSPTNLMGRVLSFNLGEQPGLLALILGSSLLLGTLAGLYPALYLTSIRPLAAMGMSGKPRTGRAELRIREALLLLQFTVSIGVIACTLMMAMQMRFVSSQPLGFSKENRVVVTLRGDAIDRLPIIENELLQNAEIQGVTYATALMGQQVSVNSTSIETVTGNLEPVQMGHMAVDEDFVDVMDMELSSGRNFAPEILTDSENAVLVNQALVDYMGWSDPLGKMIRTSWGTEGNVIGVVKDFNFRSLHSAVEPFFLYQDAFSTAERLGSDRQLVINIGGGRPDETLRFIENTITRIDPLQPFEFRFLDSALDELYLSEQRLTSLIVIFGGICLVITCLGLVGLATFTAEQRSREIGIRKVLGASRRQILRLLMTKTAVLACIAACLAALITYPLMKSWLSSFAYRIDISPVVFLAALAGVLIVAYGSIGVQTLRIARTNPVRALRYE